MRSQLERGSHFTFTPRIAPTQSLSSLDPRDGPVRMYIAQCDHWLAQALPADFCGVLEIATK